jgi:hypothetical protein
LLVKLVKRMIKSGIKFPSGRLELDMLMHFSQVFKHSHLLLLRGIGCVNVCPFPPSPRLPR